MTVWGGESGRSEGWKYDYHWCLVTRDRGIRSLLLLREFGHRVKRFSEKAGCRLSKSKTPEWLVKHWYWSFCGRLRFGEIKKDVGIFLGRLSGQMQKEKVTYSLRMKLWRSQTSQQPEGDILMIPYPHCICSPIQGSYRALGDGQEKCFGKPWPFLCWADLEMMLPLKDINGTEWDQSKQLQVMHAVVTFFVTAK